MLGSRYGVTKVTRNAAATSHAVPNAYESISIDFLFLLFTRYRNE